MFVLNVFTCTCTYYRLFREHRGGDAIVWAFDWHAKGCFFVYPGRDRPKSFKQVVTVPLSNARQQVWISQVLGDNLISGYPVLQQVWHVKEPLLISQNLHLFTGNGNVSIEVKKSLHYFHFYSVEIGRSLLNREVQLSFFGNGATSNLPFQFT